MQTLINTLGIDRLSAAERLQLIDEIWDSLETEPAPPPLTEGQKRELDRRLAALEANPTNVTPWETVERRVLARLNRDSRRSEVSTHECPKNG
jgi:putative addiction module component (TIGR02574 family)